MKKRLILCSDHKRFGHKNFHLCSTEEEAKDVAKRCKEDYNNVVIVAVPDTLQI